MSNFYDKESYGFTNRYKSWSKTITMGNHRWYPDFLPASWNHNKERYEQFSKVADRIRFNHTDTENIDDIGKFITQLSECNRDSMGYGLWKLLYNELKKKQSKLIWSTMDADNPDNKGFRGFIDALLNKLHEDDPVSFTDIYGYKTPVMSTYNDAMMTADMSHADDANNQSDNGMNDAPVVSTHDTQDTADAQSMNDDSIHYVNADDLFLLYHNNAFKTIMHASTNEDNTLSTVGGIVRFYKSLNTDTLSIAEKNKISVFDWFTDNPAEYDYYVRISINEKNIARLGIFTEQCLGIMERDKKASSALILSDTQKPSVRMRMLASINDVIKYISDKDNIEYSTYYNAIYKIPAVSDDYIRIINTDYKAHGISLQYENTNDYIDKWADAISRELYRLASNDTINFYVGAFIRKYASIIDMRILLILQNLIVADAIADSSKNLLVWVRSRKTRRKQLLNTYVRFILQGYPTEFIEQSLKTIKL